MSYDLNNVTAVIANYNGAHHLDTCVNSLRLQSMPPKRIIIVDNGSNDDSENASRRLGIDFLATHRNNGLGAAYNHGVSASSTEFVFLLNNDIELDGRCLKELVTALKADPNVFAADPLQLSWDRSEIIHYCSTLRASDKLKELAGNPFSVFPALKRVYVRHNTAGRRVPFASAGAMMVRTAIYRQLGGFDEKFFLDWEDVDLGWRANLSGHSSVFVPTAVLRHRWGASTKAAAKLDRARLRMEVSQNYNMMRFAVKCLDPLNAIGFPIARLAFAPVYAIRGAPHYALSIVLASLKLIATLPEILSKRSGVQRGRVIDSARLLASLRDDTAEQRMIWPTTAEQVWQN